MVKLKINDREIEAEQGATILDVALANGIYIPHFCYHPCLSIVGKCRMCLVEIEKMPKLQIACATTVAQDMVVMTESEQVVKARKAVLEFTLKNHPIDCPKCDKAGECTLQNYYMAYDLESSRLSPLDSKVKKKKAQVMGETLVLDQERCIICDRCLRFMREIAKKEVLCVAQRRDRSVITTFPGETVDHPYSLCLTDVCPVGAWTSRDFRFKKRVWFLTRSPSICPNCARGCNIFIDHEDGKVYRIRPRENKDVNIQWACDAGRLAYKAINENRLEKPLIRKDGKLMEVEWDEALERAASIMKKASGAAGVISADATQEQGELFKKFTSQVLKGKGPALLLKPEGDQDDFLIRADKNANAKGLAQLGIEAKPADVVGSSGLVYYVASLYDPELEIPGGADLIVQSPVRSSVVEKASVALPSASYAESEGTWVNFEGISQSFKPGMTPPGEAKPHTSILKLLARSTGSALEE